MQLLQFDVFENQKIFFLLFNIPQMQGLKVRLKRQLNMFTFKPHQIRYLQNYLKENNSSLILQVPADKFIVCVLKVFFFFYN